jgi:sorbitol-6-phosphate 2-dehydrogenase
MGSNENGQTRAEYLAPFLRGCSFDGKTGKIVITDRTGSRPGGEGEEGVIFLEPEAGEEEIVRLWRQYEEKHGAGPVVVVRKGGAVYALGNSYDQAQERLNTFLRGGPAAGPGVAAAGDIRTAAEQAAGESAGYDRSAVVCGKVAVVTGGAQGFGEGLVRELTESGALVFIADVNFEGAEKLAEELNGAGGKTVAVPVAVNVMEEESVAAMIRSVVDRAGGIDIFISNAGVLKAGSVREMELRDFRFVTEVNYIGYFLCTKHASRVMALQNKPSGRYFTDIIQINSKSGLEGSNKNGAYAGGKFGGIGLTQSFAKELVTENIKVNSICPGNFFDGPLWSDPEKGLFVQYLRAGKVSGAQSVEEVRRFYEAKVPMNRGCEVKDVITAVYYVIEQRYETGQAVPVTGGQNMLK